MWGQLVSSKGTLKKKGPNAKTNLEKWQYVQWKQELKAKCEALQAERVRVVISIDEKINEKHVFKRKRLQHMRHKKSNDGLKATKKEL